MNGNKLSRLRAYVVTLKDELTYPGTDLYLWRHATFSSLVFEGVDMAIQTTHIKTLGLIALLATLLWGCASGSGVTTTYDVNPSIDFSGYRTYAFMSDHPMHVSQAQGAVSPMLEGRLMESIRISMNGKGYNEIHDVEAADMAISFTVGSRDQIKVDTYPASFHAGYNSWGRHYGYGAGYGYGTETRVRQYTEGQLAVDVFDVASHNPAFHGTGIKKLTDSDRENQQEVLNLITNEALSSFPLAGSAGAIQAPR